MQRVLVVLVAVLSAVAAFAPAGSRTRASSLMMAEKSQALPFMAMPPALVGVPNTNGFDHVGFYNVFDIKFLREAEIKHCRVAMLAALGFVVTSFFHLPGDVHNVGTVAAHDAAVKSGSLEQILLWTSAWEIVTFKSLTQMMEGSGREPGYFGFDPLKFSTGKSDKVKQDLAMKELANGRLAMLAYGGMVTGAVLSGKEFPFY